MIASPAPAFPATYDVAYPARLSRLTTALRLIWIIPAAFAAYFAGMAVGVITFCVVVMLLVTGKYPQQLWDWAYSLARFNARVSAYGMLLTDVYPFTVEGNPVDAQATLDAGLSRWKPLVKWLLAIPHIIVLYFVQLAATVVVFIAWVAIVFTGGYPRGMFDFVVGVARWQWRLSAYTSLLSTDRYPPFSTK